jgi:hypothetical protein
MCHTRIVDGFSLATTRASDRARPTRTPRSRQRGASSANGRLLLQPIEAFALQLRTGVFRVKGGGNFEATLVPLAMDAIVSVPVADVGITVALPGDVHAYAQVRTITVWGQLRL